VNSYFPVKVNLIALLKILKTRTPFSNLLKDLGNSKVVASKVVLSCLKSKEFAWILNNENYN